MRPSSEYNQATELRATGLNDCEIARATGIPRSTIRDWRNSPRPWAQRASRRPCAVCGHPEHDFRALPRASYAYLLGMYLGDGCIDRMPRTWRLRIALDLAWPGIASECANAMQAVFPHNRILSYQPDRRSQCRVVAVYSKQLLCLFPQHGRGAKHLRPIRLAEWQAELVREAQGVRARFDPLRRMPIHEPGQGGREGLRLPALKLHERLRRHPRSLHGDVRSPGCRVATDERTEHLHREA